MLQGSLSRTDVATSLKGLTSLSPKQNPVLGVIVYAYFFLLNVGSIPVRLAFRKEIGERSITVVTFVFSFFLFVFYGFASFDDMYHMSLDPTMLKILIVVSVLLYLSIFYLGIKHFRNIYLKYKNNVIGYSYYRGYSILRDTREDSASINLDELEDVAVKTILLEGGIFILLGFCLYALGDYYIFSLDIKGDEEGSLFFYTFLKWLFYIGIALVFCGICLIIEEFGIRLRKRDAVLDIIDGEYDAKYIMRKKAELEKVRQRSKFDAHGEISNREDIGDFVKVKMPNWNSEIRKQNLTENNPSNEELLGALKRQVLKKSYD
ncbi:MAG: hypothetical protein R2824_16005 [Saprospiraceae bacterium]